MKKLLMGLGAFGGVLLIARSMSKPKSLSGLGDARHQLYSMPDRWWISDPARGEKDCFAKKHEAMIKFVEWNSRVIDNYGGMDHSESPAEFDSVNAKYGLQGNDRVTTLGKAIWVCMPTGRPYCLTNIDIEALNGTSAANEDPSGIGFQVPEYAITQQLMKEQEVFFREQEELEREREAANPVPF